MSKQLTLFDVPEQERRFVPISITVEGEHRGMLLEALKKQVRLHKRKGEKHEGQSAESAVRE